VGSGTVNAVISSNSADTTWQVADQISGGAAGSTLNLTAVVGDNISTTGRATSGIENFNITFTDNDTTNGETLTVDTSTLTGAKNFTIVSATANSGDEVAFSGLAKSQNVTIKSADEDLGVTASYKSAELSGTSDEVTVGFDGAKLGTLKIDDSATEAAETVILNAAGGASTVKGLDINSNKLKTLKVTGAGDLTVTEKIASSEFDSSATKNTINASGASGKVTLRTDLTSKLDAKGGSGTSDRLILDVASSVTTGAAISGFERVDLQASSNATVKASLITGATALNVLAGTTNNSATLTLDSVAAGTGINIVGTGKNDAQYANAVTYNQTGATSGTNDSVTIKISNGGTAVESSKVLNVGTLTANSIENVTVQVADFAKVAVGGSGLSASAAKTIAVEAGSAEVSFGSNSMGGTDTETINAGSSTGKITWGTIAATGDLTFTGSEGVDSLTIGNAGNDKTQTYNLGKGNDDVTLVDQAGSGDSGQATVNGEDGDDSFTVTFASDSSGTTIDGLALHGGAGDDTLSISGTTDNISDIVKFDKGFSGIEKIVLMASGSSGFSAEFKVANGYNEAVNVTEVSGQNVTLEFKTDAGGTIDLSNFTFLGWQSGDTIKLTGGDGNETLKGTSKADTITGGGGADTITGGAGADKFTFASGSESVGTTAIDRITDFAAGGTDKIVLDDGSSGSFFSGISLTSGTSANVNTAQTISSANTLSDVYNGITAINATTASTVQVVVVTVSAGSAAGTYLYINDGTGDVNSATDMLINITGISGTLAASDFAFG